MGDQYINKERLAQDLCALSSMPELCDVTFLVGTDRQPVCGVRAILAARSRLVGEGGREWGEGGREGERRRCGREGREVREV